MTSDIVMKWLNQKIQSILMVNWFEILSFVCNVALGFLSKFWQDIKVWNLYLFVSKFIANKIY